MENNETLTQITENLKQLKERKATIRLSFPLFYPYQSLQGIF